MANILLVDDDQQFRYTVKQMLSLDGHQIIEASDGQEALSKLNAQTHLVITDICMPNINGVDLIRQLVRQHPKLAIIGMSGGQRVLSSDFSLASARSVGAHHLLKKPFRMQELRTLVNQALTEGR
ncbi:Response regulator receiver domain-containing protein [Allopseudospirillum japonicum]|uniref:Response regulator receiver domain-containing protein n=1 Tax=Allopseudospirillum japonicum TaxID=64971 RepID=A0A1H6SAM9_9GAMM|nr:response regulator [Allopseudospirillum japonicum]SEI63866.1 Response regulator receiver domain-containing protein [Allopseudospirillum japonicum]